MKCPTCGGEIRPQASFCGRCGAPCPRLLPGFAQAEARLEALQAQYEAGALDGANFEAQRQALTLRGPDGAYWAPGGGGEWYRYEGNSWVKRDPPLQEARPVSTSSMSRPRPPADASPSVGTPQPTPSKRRSPWLWIGIGGVAILAVVACGAALVWLAYGSNWFGLGVASTPSGDTLPTALPAATPISVPDSGPSVHFASFDGEGGGPFVDRAGTGGSATTEGGAYCLQVTQPEHTFISGWDAGLDGLSLEVEGTLVEGDAGTGYGIFVRGDAEGAAGGLLFEVDGQGRWRLNARDASGATAERVGWTPSPAIEASGATNLLAALLEGTRAVFMVNGEEMVRIDDAPSGSSGVGMLVTAPPTTGGGKACFDLFRVEEIDAAQDDRQTVLTELGPPQAFDIAFGADEDGLPLRYETWTYYDYLTLLTFLDGALIEEEPLEPVDALTVAPTWYNPFDFRAGMTLGEVQTLLDEGELAQVGVPAELGPDMVLYAGEQIVVGFTAGRLEYVETLALQGIEEAEEP